MGEGCWGGWGCAGVNGRLVKPVEMVAQRLTSACPDSECTMGKCSCSPARSSRAGRSGGTGGLRGPEGGVSGPDLDVPFLLELLISGLSWGGTRTEILLMSVVC